MPRPARFREHDCVVDSIETPAVRLPDGPFKRTLRPGEYQKVWVTQEHILQGKAQEWQWWLYPPGGRLGVLTQHTVVENDDGTVRVTPSVLQHSGWHGFLENGNWKEYRWRIDGDWSCFQPKIEYGENLWVEELGLEKFSPLSFEKTRIVIRTNKMLHGDPGGPIVGEFWYDSDRKHIVRLRFYPNIHDFVIDQEAVAEEQTPSVQIQHEDQSSPPPRGDSIS